MLSMLSMLNSHAPNSILCAKQWWHIMLFLSSACLTTPHKPFMSEIILVAPSVTFKGLYWNCIKFDLRLKT